ncbi:MAG: hypothetical protein H3C62_11015 [Gemmatimonadaceae bacterium]|nr:hypothetical protein [Gemmatimonadaceae bacterium]
MTASLHLPGIPTQDACEDAATLLREAGAFRVLTPLVPPRMPLPDELPDASLLERRRALIVNTQTTGLEPQHDELLEVAALPIEYDARTGRVLATGPTIVQRRDLHRELYADEARRASLTTADLTGQRIDERFLHHAGEASNLVIAFAGAFHRQFLAPWAPKLAAERPWACAFRDIPWGERGGYRYQSLPALLASHAGMYLPETSHAAQYALAVLALLVRPFRDGSLPLAHLLEAARGEFVLMPAVGALRTHNRALRARGYHWHPGSANRERGWFKVIRADEVNREKLWLIDHLNNGRVPSWRGLRPVSAVDRLTPHSLFLG